MVDEVDRRDIAGVIDVHHTFFSFVLFVDVTRTHS
jgi:hypothetical protein